MTGYPESNEASLEEQFSTEAAIADLTEAALALWLPLAEAAVLRAAAEPPPNPAAAAHDSGQWDYLVDGLILYGIGIIAADAYDKAWAAMTGVPLAVAEGTELLFGIDMPGMPTRVELADRVNAILKRRLAIDAPSVARMAQQTPKVSSFVSEHVGNVRRRVIDAVARVYKRVRGITDDDPQPPRTELAGVFDPRDPAWTAAADEVGRTQATGTLNAALEQAARDTGRTLEIAWVAILDTHTRDGHREADGQRRAPGEAFDVDGEPLRFPGDPLGDIDNTANCRCRLFVYFTSPSPELTAGLSPAALAFMDYCENLPNRWAERVSTVAPFVWSETGKPYVFGGAPPAARIESVTTYDEPEEGTAVSTYRSFTSVLAVIGTPTDDGRMFDRNIKLSFRDMPLPLLWQKQSAGGHYDAYTVGVIESAWVSGDQVVGTGYLLNTPEADEAAMQAEHGVTGPSVDLGDVEWELRDTQGKPITEDDYWDNPDMEMLQVVTEAKVLAATLVATPAFGQTSITLGERVAKGEAALVAAAALAAPPVALAPTASAFADPGFDKPTYPHLTDDGIIRGHLAAWNVCHVGIQDRCVLAPHSRTDYTWFHTSPPIRTSEGGEVPVGRLTVGGGHAGPKLGIAPAIAHYDDVGTCFALVHVGEDAHGIWFSGIPAPGVTPEKLAEGLAAPLSGDWRAVGGNLELVAALSVNTPGFPLVASGAQDDDGRATSLIASLGPCGTANSAFGGDRHSLDEDELRVFARIILEEQAAASQRETEAAQIIAAELRRQEALALIQENL